MKRHFLAAVALMTAAAICAGCREQPERAERPNSGPVEASNSGFDAAGYDRKIVTQRGWTTADLSFAKDDSPSPTHGLALAGFRIGMTVDEVRATARLARFQSSGIDSYGGYKEVAWCAPVVNDPDRGIVLAPRDMRFGSSEVRSTATQYEVQFIPIKGQLRVGAVWQWGKQEAHIGPNLLEKGGAAVGDVTPFKACALTIAESGLLSGWDRLEDLTLRDQLGRPELGTSGLPNAVRASLTRWERGVTVKCDGSADCYALEPQLDGFWLANGSYVTAYSVWYNGVVAGWFEFIVVAAPSGQMIWTGRPDEFARRGLAGKQLTPEQAHSGG